MRLLLLLGDYYASEHRYADAIKLYCVARSAYKKLNNVSKQSDQIFIENFQLLQPRF